ncbi:phosphopantothenoylcysteine decarboxylase [Anoxybacillus sp. BCO1]|nr:phosphopantothenoylcysteine decarboxylase [Anoxybacillus sp. BCO1]
MTEAACQFVTPLTFQALSKNEVYIDTFDEKKPNVIAHIDLADWAHLVLVALRPQTRSQNWRMV